MRGAGQRLMLAAGAAGPGSPCATVSGDSHSLEQRHMTEPQHDEHVSIPAHTHTHTHMPPPPHKYLSDPRAAHRQSQTRCGYGWCSRGAAQCGIPPASMRECCIALLLCLFVRVAAGGWAAQRHALHISTPAESRPPHLAVVMLQRCRSAARAPTWSGSPPSSSATRFAMLTTARRRGCVHSMGPPRSSSRNWGTREDLPHPVLPRMMVTLHKVR